MQKNNKAELSLPKVTFAIVTLNEEARIARCLEAIAAQDYPKDKIELLLMDGGSSDRTVEIAKKYKVSFYFNEKKLAEPGLAKAYEKAKGDYMVFMAADNIVFDTQWTRKIVKPFIDDPKNVLASFSKAVNPFHDNVWNKYLNEDTDPFNAFVYQNASHPDKFSKRYKTIYENADYVIYDYVPANFPLIALAQCTVLKTGLKRKKESHFDDILPLIDIINDGGKIAFVKNTGIYHYSVRSFQDFAKKFKKRIYNSIKTNSYSSRESYISKERKFRRYLFLPYSFFIIFPLIDGITAAIRKHKFYLLLHPIVSFIIGFYIVSNYLKIKLLKQ